MMFAYLDPASSSMIVSVIAGGAAGAMVFFRSFGHRMWSTIAFWKKDDPDSAEASAETAAEDIGSVVSADEAIETSS
jgi:hypothetical protein